MPRLIPEDINRASKEFTTAPVLLCDLWLSQHTYAVTNFDKVVTVDGMEFHSANLVVRGPTQQSGGTLTATISLPHQVKGAQGRTLFKDITDKRPQDRRARIGMCYWYHDAYTQPIMLLEGVISDVKIGARIDFTIVSAGNRAGASPNIRIGKPLVNYITPEGTVVSFNGNKYEVRK